ncbi:hypothetical protein P3S68_031893 [Capsicum galapagoense]
MQIRGWKIDRQKEGVRNFPRKLGGRKFLLGQEERVLGKSYLVFGKIVVFIWQRYMNGSLLVEAFASIYIFSVVVKSKGAQSSILLSRRRNHLSPTRTLPFVHIHHGPLKPTMSIESSMKENPPHGIQTQGVKRTEMG